MSELQGVTELPTNWIAQLAACCRRARRMLKTYPCHPDPDQNAPALIVEGVTRGLKKAAEIGGRRTVAIHLSATTMIIAANRALSG